MFDDSQGRIRFHFNGDVIANAFGSVYYYTGSYVGWWYYYSTGSGYYCWAQRQSTGTRYWIGFGYYGC